MTVKGLALVARAALVAAPRAPVVRRLYMTCWSITPKEGDVR